MIAQIYDHRSVRNYKSDPIADEVLDRILQAGIRASNTGNMQMYSIVVTRDIERKSRLAPCHFNQPMVNQAPVVITFCADVNRFSMWCAQRGAQPAYDNFAWFINGAIDATLVAQNVALAAQAEGLGICYLGTTTYNAPEIVEVLELPQGVIPVTTLVVGYPEELPSRADRLPLEAVLHFDHYQPYTPEAIDELWAQREGSAQTRQLKEENDLPTLAQIFTDRRYKKEDNLYFSRKYLAALRQQGFFNHED